MNIENNEETIVGVNKYIDENEKPINTLKITDIAENDQLRKLKDLKSKRDNTKVNESLNKLREAMKDENINLMPYIMECVKNYATLEEISNVGREIYGEWKEPKIY